MEEVTQHGYVQETAVHGELLFKMLRVAGIARGNEISSGIGGGQHGGWWFLPWFLMACRRRAKCARDALCNTAGILAVFAPDHWHSRRIHGQGIRGVGFRSLAR